MRLYVAAKWEERHQARRWMDTLERAGHTITCDWTHDTLPMSAAQAQKDFDGVMTADALLFVCERNLPYCGSCVEMGMALAKGIPVYLTGRALDKRCIFVKLPGVRYDADELLRETPEKLAWAKEAADRRAERVQGHSETHRDLAKAAPEQANDLSVDIKYR